jgi:hypothetical protein
MATTAVPGWTQQPRRGEPRLLRRFVQKGKTHNVRALLSPETLRNTKPTKDLE